MNIYVGNLSFSTTEEELKGLFAGFGQVNSVSIIKDKFSGESRGFGFVEMPNATEGQAAVTQLNGKDVGGRALKVNEARSQAGGGGAGGGAGGGGGGGGRRGGSGGGRRGGGGGGGGRDRQW
jgi:RNA recognition motif-containing protein